MYPLAVFLYGEASRTSSTRSWSSSTAGESSNMAWAVVSTRIVKRRASAWSNSPAARPAFNMALVVQAADRVSGWCQKAGQGQSCLGMTVRAFLSPFLEGLKIMVFVGRSSGLYASGGYWAPITRHKKMTGAYGGVRS